MQKSVLLFASASIASVALVIGFNTNVYIYPALGGLFELLWIPCWLVLIVVPIMLFFHWKKFPAQGLFFNYATVMVLIAMYSYLAFHIFHF